ncbi:putative lipid-transfer protein DIR1 [Macadamia integrifolia]|uniref:putative lipid-transfer protein DIR1 n=1 Tax=Macadamia integrifolia TaxID=60698 RepID=UPI001C4F4430|nr:putative lipid-transfer protein DIR1 [Macadamia integrifolia]
MEVQMKHIIIVLLGLLLVSGITGIDKVHGAGECGSTPVESEALKLAPCIMAGQDANTTPSDRCCLQIKEIGKNPSCLCAVMLSQTAKSAGVKPEVAVTIPKRCNLANRPVGYKCGAYTLP